MTIHAKWCGFEGGAGALYAGFTTGGSAQAEAARTGAYGLRLQASANSPNGEFQFAPASTRFASGQWWFRFPTLPTSSVFFAQWRSSGSTVSGYRLSFNATDNTVRMGHYDSSGVLQQEQIGPVISANTWTRLAWLNKGSSGSDPNNRYMRWAIDDVERTKVGPDSTFISGLLTQRLGWSGSQTYTVHIDDVGMVWAGASTDDASVEGSFPFPPLKVVRLAPDGVGTHSGSGSFAASSGTLADSWQLLDDEPITTATGYVEQNVVGTGDYLEYTFEQLAGSVADSDIFGVQSYVAVRSSSVAANNAKFHVVDGAADSTLFNGAWLDTASPWVIENDLAVPVSGLHEWVTGGGWTVARVNALLARWGYSSDVDGIPRLPALMLETALSEGTGPEAYWGIALA